MNVRARMSLSIKVWEITLIDAVDSSGDAIPNFPDELITLMGRLKVTFSR